MRRWQHFGHIGALHFVRPHLHGILRSQTADAETKKQAAVVLDEIDTLSRLMVTRRIEK